MTEVQENSSKDLRKSLLVRTWTSLVQSIIRPTISASIEKADDLERRYLAAEERFSLIAKRVEILERRHRYLSGRIGTVEYLLECSSKHPEALWLCANRSERMDATVPFYEEDRRRFHLARYNFACDYTAGKSVADIACGTGYGTAILRSNGKASRVTGIDIDRDSVRYAESVHGGTDISFLCASGGTTPVAPESFDVVVSFETIEHVPDAESLLEEFHRILRPGGLLICSTPNQWPLELASFHVREYDRGSFEKLLQTHFDIVELYNQNSGSALKFNKGQDEGIVLTDVANQESAECFIAVCIRV